MFRLTFLFAFLGLAACSEPGATHSPFAERPMRIVSLDYCADQYVLDLADPEQILAISPDGVKPFSYLRDKAVGVPTVRPIAEDVMILKPDLVVRLYGGGPNAPAFFERAGIPVLQIGWVSDVHGRGMGSIPRTIQEMADGLGQSARGAERVAAYEARLERLQAEASGKSVLYMTPSGVTTGGNSLMHEVLTTAGLTNFMETPGWHSLPLERLAYDRPDMVAAAFFNTHNNHRVGWSSARHPIAKRELAGANAVALDGAWTACGAWFALEAVEALVEGAAE